MRSRALERVEADEIIIAFMFEEIVEGEGEARQERP